MPKKNRKNRSRVNRDRVQGVGMEVCRTKFWFYWQPEPYDKYSRAIPSSVNCLFSQEYYTMDEAAGMLRTL